MPKDKLPYVREGKYGMVTLDHSSSGQGYLVEFKSAKWVNDRWGIKDRWHTFTTFHTALAYFYALSGLHEIPAEQPADSSTEVLAERRRQGSERGKDRAA